MGSHTMLGNVVTSSHPLAAGCAINTSGAPSWGVFALLVLLWGPLDVDVFAQSELAGSWAARNTEDISRDSYPVDYVGLSLNDEGRPPTSRTA